MGYNSRTLSDNCFFSLSNGHTVADHVSIYILYRGLTYYIRMWTLGPIHPTILFQHEQPQNSPSSAQERKD